MSTANRYLPSYDLTDYQRWEGSWELLDGIPIAMTPSPFGTHQHLALQIVQLLAQAINESSCELSVLYELDWIVSDNTVVRPDVVLLCGPPPERHINEPPAFIAEILSPATRDRDLHYKKDLYCRLGVEYYLTADPDSRIIELWHNLNRQSYGTVSVALPLKLCVCRECELDVDFSSLAIK